MWGTWFAMTAGLTVGLVLLIGALILTAWSPLFAILIFLVVAIGLAAGASARRSSEYVEGADKEAAASAQRPVEEADVLGAKSRDRGAPAAGEGAPSAGQPLPPPTRP